MQQLPAFAADFLDPPISRSHGERNHQKKAVGKTYGAHDSIGSVESVKAVSDVFIPISGEILEVNESLNDTPEAVNDDPYGAAWFAKIRFGNAAEIEELMDAAAYQEYLAANAA